MPTHKTIGGVKFELRTNGKYFAKVNIPISLTEEDIMRMLYYDKIYHEMDSIDDIYHDDLKKYLKAKYQDAFELSYEDASQLELVDDDPEWQEIKEMIDRQTERNLGIIKEIQERKK